MNDCLQDNPKDMTSDLGTVKTGRLMRRYAIPCVISLLVAALYNIVDQIFIANADYLGSFGNAANAAVFPLTVLSLAGAAVNLILDPIFIYPLQMGMTGAAIATVIGQIVTAVLEIIYLCRMKCVRLTKDSFRPDGYVIRKSLSLGICSFLAQISLVIAMATTNQMIAVWGARDSVFGLAEYAQIPMAVFGIVMKVFQIVISISIGVAAGCIPIVGFNIGAGYYSRAREIFRKLLLTELTVGVAALVIVLCFPRGIIAIFGAGGESTDYTEFAVRTFRIYLCMLPLATVNKATFIFLQSLGRPVLSTFLSMLREVVLGSGFVLVLPHFFGLNGVLYSMPAADVLTAVASLIIILYVSRTLKSDAREPGIK